MQKPVLEVYFKPKFIKFLENNLGWDIQAEDNYLVMFKNGKNIPVSQYEQFVTDVTNMYKMLTPKVAIPKQIKIPKPNSRNDVWKV
jgi:hypothetical protein